MNRYRVLFHAVRDARGRLTKVPNHPLDTIPPSEDIVLKEVPGALDAWRGLSSLDLEVCVVRGPNIIIHPEKLVACHHAPLSVYQDVCGLEREHRTYTYVIVSWLPPTHLTQARMTHGQSRSASQRARLPNTRNSNPLMRSRRMPPTSWTRCHG